MTYASYFHPETCLTSIPRNEIKFVGNSLPHYDSMRNDIAKNLKGSEIPLCKVAIEEFYSVHDRKYLEKIIALSQKQEVDLPKISGECSNLWHALPGYEYGLGGAYAAIDQMKKGNLDRAYCFSLPSHHGFPNRAHGYSLLNTEAMAVRYAQKQGFEKVLVVDWDIHHGDGTQTIFENDPSVYCISIHSAVDLYMSSQRTILLGTSTYGEKVGHCNIPVLSYDFSEEFYYNELEMTGNIFRTHEVIPQFEQELNKLPFNPDIIIVFDGHDSHVKDCGKEITAFEYEDYRTLTKLIKRIATINNCPILSIPGGGYNHDTAVISALAHADELMKP